MDGEGSNHVVEISTSIGELKCEVYKRRFT